MILGPLIGWLVGSVHGGEIQPLGTVSYPAVEAGRLRHGSSLGRDSRIAY